MIGQYPYARSIRTGLQRAVKERNENYWSLLKRVVTESVIVCRQYNKIDSDGGTKIFNKIIWSGTEEKKVESGCDENRKPFSV